MYCVDHANNKEEAMVCENKQCRNHGVRFKVPTLPLERA
jgi:hypothetical protein